MNINPRTWFAGRKSNDIGSSSIARAGMAMGPWTTQINGFVPRTVNPWFYEALREALGILDGAINRMVTVDGIIAVEGGNDRLTQLIERELIGGLPVGDLQTGLQAFYAAQGNELYEQGFTVGEMVFGRRGRELIGLRVADSKGVLFHRDPGAGQLQTWYLPPLPSVTGRRDGTDAVETVLRNNGRQLNVSVLQGKGYAQIEPSRLVYGAFNPENDQPYGVSLLRGIEFVGQILLKMHNATGQSWDRFGDPVFHVNYKTKNRSLKDDALDKRRKRLAENLQSALVAKRNGNSADFTTAVGADDDITVTVIGADGQALEIEMPAKHMQEQVLAKVGLPAWMMGMSGGTAERMADNQAEVVLQESKTRFEARSPGLNRLTETWLRGRGLTWRDGDWKLVQTLPNLRDELKRAQAGFLNAQTALMQANGGRLPPADPAQRNDSDTRPGKAAMVDGLDDLDPIVRGALRSMLKSAGHTHKAAAEAWAIDDPALPRIQRAATRALLDAWDSLADDTLRVLGLPAAGKAPQAFVFDPVSMLQQLLQLQTQFILDQSGADSAMVKQVLDAWIRGIANTAEAGDGPAGADTIIAAARAQRAAALPAELHTVLQKTTVRVYEDDIVQALQDAAYNGTNPRQVAAELRKKFDSHAYDWERLVGSEISASHALGQKKALADMGLTRYDWVTAPEACSICEKIEADGPYDVATGPVPVRDSHPGCFCVIAGRAD